VVTSHRHDLGRADHPLEESAGGACVPACGHKHVHDLPELVDRAVHVTPLPGDPHIRLVHLPASSHQVPAWPSRVGQQRREPLHPAVDGDVVDLHAALGEQFLDVAVGQPEAQVPADRDDDDVGREAEASEGGPWNWSRARAAGSHADSLAAPSGHGERNSAPATIRPAGRSGASSWSDHIAASR